MNQLLHDNDEEKKKSPVLPANVKNFLIDIDGTIGEDIPNEEPWRMEDAEVFPDALAKCNQWYFEGHIICFFTSRTEAHRQVTENWLTKHGFLYHAIVFGKPRGGNYYWIDNHKITSVRYEGVFSDIVEQDGTISVFKNK
jgi:uncharacterized HAD superfamily protein